MKKYTWIVALLVALSFVAVGCDTGGGTKKPPKVTEKWMVVFDMATDEGIQALPVDTMIDLSTQAGKDSMKPLVEATDDGKQADIVTVAGPGAQKIALKVISTTANWGAGIDMPQAAFNFRAGDKVTVTGNIIKQGVSPSDGTPRVELNFTPGSEQAHGTEQRQATGEFTIDIELTGAMVSEIKGANPKALRISAYGTGAEVVINNIHVEGTRATDGSDEDDGAEEEEEVIVPPEFDATDPAALKHTNPVFIKYGGWGNSFELDGNTVTIAEQLQANFAYVLPTTGYTLADWDFVELSLTTTGTISNFGYKYYESSSSVGGDATGRTGALASDDDSTIKLEIMKNPHGLGFQKYTADSNAVVVKINSATFTKGTRVNFNLDADGGTGVPATFYLVDGTTVANHLPVPVKAGHIFLGWKNGANFVNASTVVSSALSEVTLMAGWKTATAYAPQTVVFNETANTSGYVRAFINSGDRTGTVTLVDTPTAGTGYTIAATGNSYGNVYAYFNYTFTNGADLSDFTKVTFHYTGVSGDIGGKVLKMVVKSPPSSFNYIGFDAESTPISTVSVTGTSPTPITMDINQGLASALDGQSVAFAIGMHCGDYSFTITGVTFSQD